MSHFNYGKMGMRTNGDKKAGSSKGHQENRDRAGRVEMGQEGRTRSGSSTTAQGSGRTEGRTQGRKGGQGEGAARQAEEEGRTEGRTRGRKEKGQENEAFRHSGPYQQVYVKYETLTPLWRVFWQLSNKI